MANKTQNVCMCIRKSAKCLFFSYKLILSVHKEYIEGDRTVERLGDLYP
jgi:hypothetical protein